MQVRVKLYARFKELAGRDELTVEGVRTLKELRKRLSTELGVDQSSINFIVNGVKQPDEFSLNDEELVIAFPQVSGGCCAGSISIK